MDFNQGLSSIFWQSSDIHICSNPKQPLEKIGLMKWVQQQPYLQGHLLIATSGTTGNPRWVALSKQAILYAAKQVNEYFNIHNQDQIALNLPLFHVAGLGILARCFVSCATCHDLRQLDQSGNLQWDAQLWQKQCSQKGITIASLVPAQIADLIQQQLSCPESMRLIFVGGDTLSPSLAKQAAQLGWPLHLCYGMTETSAMLAVEKKPKSGMRLLPHWQYQKSPNDQAQFKGLALLTGYVTQDAQQQWNFQTAVDEQGWFTCDDSLIFDKKSHIQFIERHHQIIKILGEKVFLAKQLHQLQTAITQVGLPLEQVMIITEPHPRRGASMIPTWENIQQQDSASFMPQLNAARKIYHEQQANQLTALEDWRVLINLERTALGKKRFSRS